MCRRGNLGEFITADQGSRIFSNRYRPAVARKGTIGIASPGVSRVRRARFTSASSTTTQMTTKKPNSAAVYIPSTSFGQVIPNGPVDNTLFDYLIAVNPDIANFRQQRPRASSISVCMRLAAVWIAEPMVTLGIFRPQQNSDHSEGRRSVQMPVRPRDRCSRPCAILPELFSSPRVQHSTFFSRPPSIVSVIGFPANGRTSVEVVARRIAHEIPSTVAAL